MVVNMCNIVECVVLCVFLGDILYLDLRHLDRDYFIDTDKKSLEKVLSPFVT